MHQNQVKLIIKRILSRKALFLIAILSPASILAQTKILDSLIQANKYVITFDGHSISGSGSQFLAEETRNTQFVVLGEEHNTLEIPQFTTALFELLQEKNGFNYLALEQDPYRCETFSSPQFRRKIDSAFSLLKRAPYSYTFSTDQEVEMISRVSGHSKGKGNPVWGCDQAFGAMHILQELVRYAPHEAGKKYLSALLDTATNRESIRKDGKNSFVVEGLTSDHIRKIKSIFSGYLTERVNWLVELLQSTQHIYELYRINLRHENRTQREDYFKKRMYEEYKLALSEDKTLPRVIMKFGHWHAMNGFNPGDVLSTGNFVRSLAFTNNMESLYIEMQMYGAQGTRYARILNQPAYSKFIKHCRLEDWTLIDLRPFRHYAEKIKTEAYGNDTSGFEALKKIIFGADVLLIFGNGRRGTYSWQE